MSESKFTPGAWSIGWRLAHLGDEERRVTAIGGAAGEWVALLPHGWFDGFGVVEDGELKANARLIAAAPELYEALASLLQDVKEYVRVNNLADSDGKPASNDAMRRAEAALLKATPEQSGV